MNDEMLCVIANENLEISYSSNTTRAIRSKKLHSYFLENDTMKNQESSANTEVPFDVIEITADDINMEVLREWRVS